MAAELNEHLASLSGAATLELEEKLTSETEEVTHVETVDGEDAGQNSGPVAVADEAPTGEPEEVAEPLTYEELQAQLAEEQRQKNGIRNEMIESRRRASEYKAQLDMQGQSLQNLEKSIADMAKKEEEPDPYADDPAAQFIRKEIGGLREEIHGNREEVNRHNQVLQQAEQIASHATQAAAQYRDHTPDWDDARMHVRGIVAATNAPDHLQGQDLEGYLNAWETSFAKQCLDQGQDPAHQLYERARRAGFTGGAAAAAPNGAPLAEATSSHPESIRRRVRRVEKGVNEQSLSGVPGRTGGHDPGVLTRDQVSQLPQAQRFAIYGDSDMLEQLNANGRVELPGNFFE